MECNTRERDTIRGENEAHIMVKVSFIGVCPS